MRTAASTASGYFCPNRGRAHQRHGLPLSTRLEIRP
jgi:hypothetical protein